MKEKRLYVVTHEHRFGTSAYIVWANHCPTEQEVVTALDIDFEPDRAETISIGSVEPGNIKDIPDRPEGPGEEWQGDSDGTVGVD